MNPTLVITLGYLVALAAAVGLSLRYLQPFHRRAVICLTAVLLSALVVTRSGWRDALAKADLGAVPVGGERDLISRVRQVLNWAALKDKLRDKYPAVKGTPAFEDAAVGQTQKLVDAAVAAGAKADEVKKFIADT